MAEQSKSSEDLFLLDGIEDFQTHCLELVKRSRRTLEILSQNLDPAVYGNEEFIAAVSAFARSSRYAQVFLLVKNTKLVATSGHPLAKLHQRLPTKILLRRLTQEPVKKEIGYLMGDTKYLTFKNDDEHFKGFCNWDAAVECKSLKEEFDRLWQTGESEPDLQLLHI